MSLNYYDILELGPGASLTEIKKAYHRLAKQFHPDKNPGNKISEEKFKRIKEAYEILIDHHKKTAYDERRKQENKSKAPYGIFVEVDEPSKGKYTPAAIAYGKLFILILLTLVMASPVVLTYQMSKQAYKRAQIAEAKGDFIDALIEYRNAIKQLGARSNEAALAGAKMSLNKLKDEKAALAFIEKGFKVAGTRKQKSNLFIIQAEIYKQGRRFDEAIASYEKAVAMGLHSDSLLFESASILNYQLQNCELAKSTFEQLIEKQYKASASLTAIGWCLQQQYKNEKAIDYFQMAIKLDSLNENAHFMAGFSFIMLQDEKNACALFRQAALLGHERAYEYYKRYCITEEGE